MIWISPGRRLPLTIALLVGLIVVGTILGHTHGAQPQAGATYTGTVFVETPAGTVTQRLPISFQVTRSGRNVTRFRFSGGLPRACQTSPPAGVRAASVTAPVRTPSRFEVNLALDAGAGRVGTLEISGSFHPLKRESGAVAARYSSPGLARCDASGGYTAKAVG